MNPKFEIEFLDEVVIFLDNLDEKAREKIYYNLKKAQISNDSKLFKKISDEIWEFRTLFNKTHYRLFAFWDKSKKQETLVISTHGIEKRTKKIPIKELHKAKKLRIQYFKEKNK